jgi:HipA-like protein
MSPKKQENTSSSLAVFLEKRKTRIYVGKLTFLKSSNVFEFTYDNDYIYAKNIIPLGPEFPLTQKVYRSSILFPSLQDRIPSRENSAYAEYCKSEGIDVKESDPIILLTTIGKRGPSSFVFEPLYEDSFSKEDLKKFRQELGLTTREFALCFDLTQAALMRIEKGDSSGKALLKRIEIYYRFPEVALFFIHRHGGAINSEKKKTIIKILKAKLNG